MDVLFPYAREHMPEFIEAHAEEPEVRSILNEVAEASGTGFDLNAITRQLLQWIDEDKKITPLKALQGMIWKAGYASGDFNGHVYDDVPPVLQSWHAQGIQLYIYSSGSVEAQKLLFSNTSAGDLTPLFSGYFDTRIGNKREAESYRKISKETGIPAGEFLFLSDVEQELDAAKQVGMHTLQLVREDTTPSANHPIAHDFTEINIKNM